MGNLARHTNTVKREYRNMNSSWKHKHSEEQAVKADNLCYWPRELCGDTQSSRNTTTTIVTMTINDDCVLLQMIAKDGAKMARLKFMILNVG